MDKGNFVCRVLKQMEGHNGRQVLGLQREALEVATLMTSRSSMNPCVWLRQPLARRKAGGWTARLFSVGTRPSTLRVSASSSASLVNVL